jgi:hypothetical protein
MVDAQRIRAALHKPITPVLFFFGGVTFDTLTLTRIDRLSDNLILLGYLALLGFLIVAMGRAGRASTTMETAPLPAAAAFMERTRPYHPMAIQFLLGGLLSAYAVYYSHSASFTSTAVFFALLVGLLVGNEFLHDQVSNVRLMLALYALAACSFLTFFLPVITGVMSTAMFLAGAVLSAVLAIAMVRLIYRGDRLSSPVESIKTALPALLVVGTLVAFYFLNWIPPVPLSMSFGGVYHRVARSGDVYELTFEKPPWYRFGKRSDDPFRGEGAHCFTAIFAPIDLRADIYHHWQHRATEGANVGRFVTTDRIPVAIVGGRDGGYRAFTVKQRVAPGDWRVNVETVDGRIIGRVSFRAELSPEPLAFKTILY